MKQVLLVEDEAALAEVLADNLQSEGLGVQVALDGAVALELWQQLNPDLVVLDVMLPKLDGITVCRRMREGGSRTPVLFLSAKGEASDRVDGLEAGGDDYVTKPFHLKEFLLRVQNMLRRQEWLKQDTPQGHTISFAGHTVDFRTWTAHLASGRSEVLGERELMILKLLVERVNEVVSRDEILDRVWGSEVFPSSRTIDNFVVRLRRLLEPNPASPVYLHTVWGVGYRFTPELQEIASTPQSQSGVHDD
jgi:two-component system alkaline phosphatase synthesis response regulator PhoP